MVNYKVGDKIEIFNMDGEPEYEGRRGIIEYIETIYRYHGTWGELDLLSDTDRFVKINEEGEYEL